MTEDNNPFEFIPDYQGLREPIPYDTVLRRLYNCVNNDTFVDQQRQGKAVQRLPLDANFYTIYGQGKR